MVETFEQIRDNLQLERYMVVAFTTIVFWDHLVTFGKEYRLMWTKQRWTVARVLFFANRYWLPIGAIINCLSFMGDHSFAVCTGFIRFNVVSWIIVTMLTDAILAVRVWAVWLRSRVILGVIIAMLLFELGFLIASASQLNPVYIPPAVQPILRFKGCAATPPSNLIHIVAILGWTPSLIYNLVLFLLILFKVFYVKKECGMTLPLLRRVRNSGIPYVALVVAVNVVELYFAAQKTPSVQALFLPAAASLPSIFCSRLVLDLRSHGHRKISSNLAFPPKPLERNQPRPVESSSQGEDERESEGVADLDGARRPSIVTEEIVSTTQPVLLSSGEDDPKDRVVDVDLEKGE